MIRSLVFACLLVASTVVQAQYPSRPILLLVPYTARSDADLAARNLAQHAPRYLNGQSVVVMNQPGASGAIGTVAVRNAPPDGHRLLLARIASHRRSSCRRPIERHPTTRTISPSFRCWRSILTSAR